MNVFGLIEPLDVPIPRFLLPIWAHQDLVVASSQSDSPEVWFVWFPHLVHQHVRERSFEGSAVFCGEIQGTSEDLKVETDWVYLATI